MTRQFCSSAVTCEKPLALVITHPRSGTHLTIDLMRRNLPALRSWKYPLEPLDCLYVPIDIALDGSTRSVKRVQRLVARHDFPILKSHFLSPDLANLRVKSEVLATLLHEHGKPIYVVRHPLKVLASLHLFERTFRKGKARSEEQWLSQRSARWCHHVEKWTNHDGVLVLRAEDTLRDPCEAVNKIAEHLNVAMDLKDPPLPARLASKWVGRWRRAFATTSETTEIIAPGQGASFHDLFATVDIGKCLENVSPLCAKFGYELPTERVAIPPETIGTLPDPVPAPADSPGIAAAVDGIDHRSYGTGSH